MKYSIIVPYQSNENYFLLCLDSLKKTVPKDVEIILVINNTQKDEVIIRNKDKKFKILRINKNIGYSNAINIGAENASGKYLIFSDSDTAYLQKDWFYNLTSFYTSNKNIGIASSKLINPSTNRIIDFGMAISKYNNAHPYMDRPIDFEPALRSRRVQMACSANMIIEKDLFIKMGMIDTDLVNYYQDTDICLKLKDFKKECWVVADSLVYHRGSSSNVNRESYRADIKGYYVAKNLHRMERDLGEYFEINHKYYKRLLSDFPDKRKYLLVDMTTIADGKWFYELIKKYFRIYDVYELKYTHRDTDHISLIDFLGVNILTNKVPIIYFVDRYISLTKNSLWTHFRNCERDIIVDRNANIVSFNQLDKS